MASTMCCCREAGASRAAASVGEAVAWHDCSFFIKWRHRSYTACSWEGLVMLQGLAGAKRVTNYMKKVGTGMRFQCACQPRLPLPTGPGGATSHGAHGL